MKMILLTNKYPSLIEPNALIFVQQLIWEFADQNVDVTIICPSPINLNFKYIRLNFKDYEVTDTEKVITIYRPKYISLGQTKILGINPAKITTFFFTSTVKRIIMKEKISFDFVYGHFITPAGIASSRIGKYFKSPSFIAYGEATTNTIHHFGKSNVISELKSVSGFISVSTKNKRILNDYLSVPLKKIRVFPNGVRTSRFNKKDKVESREKFGLPMDKFIVSFVGSFDQRKGIKRLELAIDLMDDIYFIVAGSGKLKPQSRKCLFSDNVSHEDLPYFYSASDVFVLPTTDEGSCNAIIEAISCGIPIISSNKEFNNDILNEKYAILINPESVLEIKDAISSLRNLPEKLDIMQKEAVKASKNFNIRIRAINIIDFVGKKVNEHKFKSKDV